MSAIKTFFKVLKDHLQIFGVELNTKISPEVSTEIEANTEKFLSLPPRSFQYDRSINKKVEPSLLTVQEEKNTY